MPFPPFLRLSIKKENEASVHSLNNCRVSAKEKQRELQTAELSLCYYKLKLHVMILPDRHKILDTYLF